MRLDKYGQSIFDQQDIFNLIYENDLEKITDLIVENTADIKQFNNLLNNSLTISENLNYNQTREDFDVENQKNWFMPSDYRNMDIEEFLVNQCPKENYQRLVDELVEFRARNMLDLLRWLKYFVDTCREKNIVWGVGRGSSVSSYVLYLIGVHKIDSIKYNLDYKEFLR
jgi:DNA polymerase III alpha subunit